MWRVLPVILLLSFVAAVVLVFLVVVPTVERRARRRAVKDRAEQRLTEFQTEASIDDIRRHRQRINDGIDEQHAAMRDAKRSSNPLDL